VLKSLYETVLSTQLVTAIVTVFRF